MIHLAHPIYLLLLLLVLAMAGAGVWLARWRRRARTSFAGPQAQRWQPAQVWPALLFLLLGATLIVLAAARPQWGSRQQTHERQGIDLVIALDVSQSMQATDVAPSRIGVAQAELTRLVEAQRGSRIGLVIFAGSSFLRSPLTTDTVAMSQLIRRADRDAALTNAGSDVGSALEQAQRVLDASDTPGKAVLVVSDGEDFAHTYADKVATLRQKGVAVYTAGVGTAQGATLTDRDARGQTRLKVDSQGKTVITRLDEATLQAIAGAGGGRYVRLGAQSGALLSLRDDLGQLQQTRIADESGKVPIERYQAFVIAALVLLAESWLLPARIVLPSLRRLRRLRPHPGLALVAIALLLGACGSKADPLREKNAAANRLYDAGNFQGSLDAYQALLAQRPDVPALSINAGNALHRLESYDRAVAETQRALSPADPSLDEVAYYDLGDHLFAGGQFEEAYDAFKNALLRNPNDLDAKYNLELTLRELARKQPPQGQQPGDPAPSAQTPDQQPQQPGESPQQGPGQPAPQSGQTPAQPGAPGQSGADVTRQLQDALKGIDQNLSFEQASHILDLLRQQQESQRQGGRPAPTVGADY